ncbi:MAG: glycoprotein endo-alpha-1,2-mannosidase, partial [Oceanospirillaceae bacterium]
MRIERSILRIIVGLVLIIFVNGCQEEAKVDPPNPHLHTFYYNWYGNPETDDKYYHWAHDILPHWSDTTWDNAGSLPGGDDIGANFYPSQGCYSSNDTNLVRTHMKMIRDAGIGVAVITWWGKDSYEDRSIPIYLEEAEKAGIQVAFHLEPFYSTVEEFRNQLEYIVKKYGNHPSLFRVDGKPFHYVYDSYKVDAEDWARLLSESGNLSIRNTELDGTFIGLWVEENEHAFFLNAGFDGFYTYFASDGFVYGSTITNWKTMSHWAKENDLIFIPCAGPGYLDTRIRPWNDTNTKPRNGGEYYKFMFNAAVESQPDFIGITSFNEWHEGTQIEPSISKSIEGYSYEDF